MWAVSHGSGSDCGSHWPDGWRATKIAVNAAGIFLRLGLFELWMHTYKSDVLDTQFQKFSDGKITLVNWCSFPLIVNTYMLDICCITTNTMFYLLNISFFQSGTVPDVLQATLINIQGDSVDIPMDDLAKGKLKVLFVIMIKFALWRSLGCNYHVYNLSIRWKRTKFKNLLKIRKETIELGISHLPRADRNILVIIKRLLNTVCVCSYCSFMVDDIRLIS